MNRKENGMKKYDLINGAAAREEALRLLTPDELVTMNLFELIFSFPEASAWTDHESFIIGQSNEKTPIWMWLSERCGSESAECAADIIASRLEVSPNVHLNAVSHRCRETLEYTERKGFHSHRVMDMNAYVCARVISPECSGEAVFSSEEDRPAMASLLRQLCEDGEHTVISQEDADNFAAASVGRSELLLWKDGWQSVRNGDDRPQERVERADKYRGDRPRRARQGIRRDARFAYVRKAYRRGRVSDALRRRGESVVEQGVPQDRI